MSFREGISKGIFEGFSGSGSSVKRTDPLPVWALRLGTATRKWRTWTAQRRPLPVPRSVRQPEARSLKNLSSMR